MFSNLVTKASKFAMEGVKNLGVKQHVEIDSFKNFSMNSIFVEITRYKNRRQSHGFSTIA